MFKIIKNFNWIILSSFLCIFMGIVTFLTFINEGFVPLTDKNLQTLLIIDIFLLLIFFSLIFKNFYRFYSSGKKLSLAQKPCLEALQSKSESRFEFSAKQKRGSWFRP